MLGTMAVYKPTCEDISAAADVLLEVGIVTRGNADNKYCYPEAFGSYPSSFAATVSQCGLLRALIFFEDDDSKSQSNRERFPEAVRLYMKKRHPGNPNRDKLLSEQVAADNVGMLKEQIMNASTALKIALRMFTPSEKVSVGKYGRIPRPIEKVNPPQGSSANIGYQFYHSVGIPGFVKKQVKSAISVNTDVLEVLRSADYSVVNMRVQAPGLLIGSGLAHGLPGSEEDVKTGLQFDYTSGLPVIPGSSVKGVIRSAFPTIKEDKKQPEEGAEKQIEDSAGKSNSCEKKLSVADVGKLNYIRSLIADIPEFSALGLEDNDILELGNQMFNHGDIFADALLVGYGTRMKQQSPVNQVLAEDYITPHTGGPLAQPIPIKIVKVAPGVTFAFCYKFNVTKIGSKEVTAKMKESLCTAILQDLGIGAKTNVGYGVLKKIDNQ